MGQLQDVPEHDVVLDWEVFRVAVNGDQLVPTEHGQFNVKNTDKA